MDSLGLGNVKNFVNSPKNERIDLGPWLEEMGPMSIYLPHIGEIFEVINAASMNAKPDYF